MKKICLVLVLLLLFPVIAQAVEYTYATSGLTKYDECFLQEKTKWWLITTTGGDVTFVFNLDGADTLTDTAAIGTHNYQTKDVFYGAKLTWSGVGTVSAAKIGCMW